MLLGREGPDLGPVESPSSSAASPTRGPGACRNEKRQGGEGALSGDDPCQAELGVGKGRRQVRDRDPGGKGRYPREVTATAYFSFPKYSLPVGSGPDVWVVAEERGALPSSRLLPCTEGLRSPLASVFRSSIGTSESSTVLGKGFEERGVRSCSQYQITMATDF